MDHTILAYSLLLVILVVGLSIAAGRLNIAAPVVMIAAGAALSFVPVMPTAALNPELVLLLLLPPLLYSSGVNMSWRGFRSNLRPILLLAVGCVLFTASAVALVANWLFGLPWAIGFIIGSIVSPPDAVAPMAIMRRLALPRRVVTILEGESLVNDATALVAFSFAVAAVATGQFSAPLAVAKFGGIVLGELAYGGLVGWAMLMLRHAAREPRAEVLLALATPFIAFWPPHHFGGSGVIACVVAGLYVSWNGRRLIAPATRLQGYFIWGLLTWSIELLLFLLTGLQARAVIESLGADGWTRPLLIAGVVSLTIILVRFIWVFPASYGPRLVPSIRQADPAPNWRLPFLVSYAGLRGAVSLAAALSIPLTVNGQPFPERSLILFVTFVVIVVTLVGLGATLPAVVRWLGLTVTGQEEAAANKRSERTVRLEGIDAVLKALAVHRQADEAPPAVRSLSRQHEDRRRHVAVSADPETPDDPVAEMSRLQLGLIEVERGTIALAYDCNRLTDEARRRIERELDLEEARLNHALASTGSGAPRHDD